MKRLTLSVLLLSFLVFSVPVHVAAVGSEQEKPFSSEFNWRTVAVIGIIVAPVSAAVTGFATFYFLNGLTKIKKLAGQKTL
jgi:hypothetical protein